MKKNRFISVVLSAALAAGAVLIGAVVLLQWLI